MNITIFDKTILQVEKYNEQEQVRRSSLKELIALGVNPYPAEEFKINNYSGLLLFAGIFSISL